MLSKEILTHAYKLMCQAQHMANVYDINRQVCKYVHSTSRGHEAIQIATGLQLKAYDYCSPYYRDESMLLAIGMKPYELMLQLLAKAEDPFSGGRTYYSHPSLKRENMPKIPHQSSATGMQAIPTAGMAHGIKYLESQGLLDAPENPVVVCSLGDGSVTEGEVAEALQMAVLAKLPLIILVQDNDWGISASGAEMRAMDAYEYAAGFKGLERMRVNGSDFQASYTGMAQAIQYVRDRKGPILVHAKVPLLGHHTSGVRKEWYRGDEDLDKHSLDDPRPKLAKVLRDAGIEETELELMDREARELVEEQFYEALNSPDPDPSTVADHVFAPTPVTEEKGERNPAGAEVSIMVDAALHAMDEILKKHPEALFYGQDVGRRLGGVFREAATLAGKYGDERVFNTPIQEAYIVGSTVGMSAVGAKPIVEIQFADYIWTGVNQLVCELSKSCYLTMGKYPVQSLIRVPTGGYGGGGPYHSGTVESSLLALKGIKIVYPSNAADMKGLMKGAFYDPNPVIMFEHKGLYWSKVPGTEGAKMPEPSEDYIIPLGKGRVVLEADADRIKYGESLCIITYGMGVYWALAAEKQYKGQVEIIDLRTLNPVDHELVYSTVNKHGKCIVLTEETLLNSFAESLAARISKNCFRNLDAAVETMGSMDLPAVALNVGLEAAMLPSAQKVADLIGRMLEE